MIRLIIRPESYKLKVRPIRPNKALRPRNLPIRVEKRKRRRKKHTEGDGTNEKTKKAVSQLAESMPRLQNKRMLA